jgi:colicin import membrane protein
MIDEFVSTVYESKVREEQTAKLAAAMTSLPTSELKKIARYGLGMPMNEPWIDKYKGTPLFEQAMQLEQQYLQLELQQNEADNLRQQSWNANDQLRAAQDALCVQKRMLDLQLATHEHQANAEEEAAEQVQAEQAAMQAAAQPPAPEPAAAPSPEVVKAAAARMRIRLMQKEALSMPSMKAVGSAAGNLLRRNQPAALGAGVGAAAGGIGAGASGEDGFSLRRALGGAALGAAGGAAAGKATQLGSSAARIRALANKNAKTVGAGVDNKARMGWGEAARRAWNVDVKGTGRALKPLGVTQEHVRPLTFGGTQARTTHITKAPATKERQIAETQVRNRNPEGTRAAGSALRELPNEDEIAKAFAARGLG